MSSVGGPHVWGEARTTGGKGWRSFEKGKKRKKRKLKALSMETGSFFHEGGGSPCGLTKGNHFDRKR